MITTVDTKSGGQTQRTLDAWNGSVALGWSPDSAVLFFVKDVDHVDYFAVASPTSPLHAIEIAAADYFFAVGRAPVAPPPTTKQRYAVDTKVGRDTGHNAALCILPTTLMGSDCAGPKITNWGASKSFGDYHLVGTYDGKVFTLTEPPVADKIPRPTTPHIDAPCPAPPGGWHATDTTKIGLTDFQAFQASAQGAPDFAGLWMANTSASAPVNDFQHTQVTVVAYTGDIARHRSELAAIWGGPVCVVQHAHPYTQLQMIMNDLSANGDTTFGTQMISVGPYEVDNDVRYDVVAATPATQAALDRHYGPGLVKVSSVLQPIP